ncbi:asparaginase domain-containing protein [Saxibacter everestensis]|uniref:Asparaginase domain-containing protein n=1 Tax=Saxibacter everestensis TaxID=2909229 RepID=A0ABY8QWK6_9MICO|nr:asparaginase domain-containing protein [Brevibacteriaceae bacterium ZFBP1038]
MKSKASANTSEPRAARLGIITGSGPEAGLDLWSKVLRHNRSMLGELYQGDADAPHLIIVSVPELGHSMELESQEERVWWALERTARQLSPQVDYYVIACNTLNYYADRLDALGLSARLITPTQVVVQELQRLNTDSEQSVALLGSRQTMDVARWSSYASLAEHFRVELPADDDSLHRLIYDVKQAGGSTPRIEDAFLSLTDSLDSTVVLQACTELPLINVSSEAAAKTLIDVSDLLARALAEKHVDALLAGLGHDADGADPRLLVVYTGGTFGMHDLGAGLEANAELKAEISALIDEYDERRTTRLRWGYVKLDRIIDSAESSQQTAVDLAAEIRSNLDGAAGQAEYDGVLVIHGTDTLAYTASRVAFELADLHIPVVFTGAQLPLGFTGSDAPSNFAYALDVLTGVVTRQTWVALNHELHPAVRVSKYSSESMAGFASPRPLAPVTNQALADAVVVDKAMQGAGNARNIGLLSVFPGISAENLRAALACYPDGLVMECYGAGTAPVNTPGFVDALAAAVNAGTPVLAITQCQTGAVSLSRYAVGSVLADAGVIGGGDMTLEAALAKLGYLVSRDLDLAAIRDALAVNLIGEITTAY